MKSAMQRSIPPRWSIDSSIFDAYKIDELITSDIHWHSHFLLNIITAGEGVQEINGKREIFVVLRNIRRREISPPRFVGCCGKRDYSAK